MTEQTALVFDMDGLMVDTEPLARQAWNEALSAYGHVLDDATYASMIGYRSDVSAQLVLSRYNLPLTATELIRNKEKRFDSLRAKGVPVMPGLMELQAELAHRGIPWAVATSSSRNHAHRILNQLGLSQSCRVVAAGDEVAHGKPAPDIYYLAADRLGLAPDRCLALEDSQPGCEAAAAAGMRVVAVPNGQTRGAGFGVADHVMNSLHDVLDNLDRLLTNSL